MNLREKKGPFEPSAEPPTGDGSGAEGQTEYTRETPLLDESGNLLARGWARRNVFKYDRSHVRRRGRLKEWDYFQLSDGKLMAQICFANIAIGSCASACLVDLTTGEVLVQDSCIVPFTRNRFLLPDNGDRTNSFHFAHGRTQLSIDTDYENRVRTLHYKGRAKGKPVDFSFTMSLLEDHENITIVMPFPASPEQFFMTTKQNCMPCEGKVDHGDRSWALRREETFAVMDWGRGLWPHNNEWYWGNGAQRVVDDQGNAHLFGFEITWKIGDESHATETCLFFDGRAHKIGAVDVREFPGDKGWRETWEFTSEDGRFDMTMTPFQDYHSGFILGRLVGMESHQVHGMWNGRVVLDDGTELEIENMYAFCEYMRNAW